MAQCLCRDEMIALVRRIMGGEELADELEVDVELFLENCQHPAGTDLIFWPTGVPHDPNEPDLTAEEIADKAMSWKLVQLTPEQIERLQLAGLILSPLPMQHVKYAGGYRIAKPRRAGGISFPGVAEWEHGELCDAPGAYLYGENGRWTVAAQDRRWADLNQTFESAENAVAALLAFYFGTPGNRTTA
jgi:hypothetical protein